MAGFVSLPLIALSQEQAWPPSTAAGGQCDPGSVSSLRGPCGLPARYLEQMLIGPHFASSAKPEELCDVPAHELGQGRDLLWLRGQLLLMALVFQPFHVLNLALSVRLENHWGLQRGLLLYCTQTLHNESPLWC